MGLFQAVKGLTSWKKKAALAEGKYVFSCNGSRYFTEIHLFSGLLTGQDPTRGSTQDVFIHSRAEPGRIKRYSKSHGLGRVGSGRVRRVPNLRVGPGHPDLTWPVRSDLTREKPWLFFQGKATPLEVRLYWTEMRHLTAANGGAFMTTNKEDR